MPIGLNNLMLKGFYSFSKTIQPNFRFYVTVFDRDILTVLPIIKYWHVLSVSVPNYDWKKEVVKYGPLPKSLPYLDYDGMEFKNYI